MDIVLKLFELTKIHLKKGCEIASFFIVQKYTNFSKKYSPFN